MADYPANIPPGMSSVNKGEVEGQGEGSAKDNCHVVRPSGVRQISAPYHGRRRGVRRAKGERESGYLLDTCHFGVRYFFTFSMKVASIIIYTIFFILILSRIHTRI